MTTLVSYKKALFNYEPIEKFEAGIELTGSEVKSIKSHQGRLDGSYVIVRGGEAYLVGSYIPPYQIHKDTLKDIELLTSRNRRLLLHKKEIQKLADTESGKGLTIIPLQFHVQRNKIKLTIAIAKGKKKYDKRETIKKRDTEREIQRLVQR